MLELPHSKVIMAKEPTQRAFAFSLGRKFVIMLAAIILLILLGQTLVSLSNEVTVLDSRIATEGTILAQSIASSSSGMMDGDNPDRFAPLFARVANAVDLIDVAIVNRDDLVVGHSNPDEVGAKIVDHDANVFGKPRTSQGLVNLIHGETEYTATAPILKGTSVLGFVHLRFKSGEVADRAGRLIASAAAMGLFWLLVGAAVGTLYVRRITKPIAALTLASASVIDGELDDVELPDSQRKDEVGLLQRTFVHLLESLKGKEKENRRLMEEVSTINERLKKRVDEVTSELQETTAYLQSVIRCMEEGVITCDPEGWIVQFNDGARLQLQGLGTIKVGESLRSLVADGEELAEAVFRAIRETETVQLELVRTGNQTKGTETRTLVFRIYPLLGLNGESMGAVMTAFDVTQSRRVDEQLRRHDRLASLGTIAAGLAHELGNNMHAINGFSSLLLRSIPASSPEHGDAEAIHSENTRAIQLLDRFMLFAQPRDGVSQMTRIDALIEEALGMCGYQAHKWTIQVTTDLADEGRELECDGKLMTQVFLNLSLNALQAMQKSPVKRLTVSSRWKGEALEIVFEDTGTGIAPNALGRIFDPFFTTKSEDGSGLGLSISHQIIERHQGTIAVESEVGVGTRITVELPASKTSGDGSRRTS